MRISSVSGNPTSEEVAAIAAAIAVLDEERRRAAAEEPASLRMWVHASRRAAQRAGMQRGPWRMSGRLPRRSRT